MLEENNNDCNLMGIKCLKFKASCTSEQLSIKHTLSSSGWGGEREDDMRVCVRQGITGYRLGGCVCVCVGGCMGGGVGSK